MLAWAPLKSSRMQVLQAGLTRVLGVKTKLLSLKPLFAALLSTASAAREATERSMPQEQAPSGG